MALIRICDVCRDEAGPGLFQVYVPGPVHPHDGDPICVREQIDVCAGCLRRIPDLGSDLSLDEMTRLPKGGEVPR
jgi:hypothetical protein